MASTSSDLHQYQRHLGKREEKQISRLSYKPSPDEMPLFESLFRCADTTKNGTDITIKEALEVLSLSYLSRQKLNMILNMAKSSNSSTLKRDQFYVAIRLVQLRQNHESVRNLTLTVPDGVDLNPPYFKGIDAPVLINSYAGKAECGTLSPGELQCTSLDKSSLEKSRRLTDEIMNHDDDLVHNSSESPSSLKCLAMENQIKKLKLELQTTMEQLNVVTRDNYILRQIGLERVGSSIPLSFKKGNENKPNGSALEDYSLNAKNGKIERDTLTSTSMLTGTTNKSEEVMKVTPRGRSRLRSRNRDNHSVLSIPQITCDDSVISDITEFSDCVNIRRRSSSVALRAPAPFQSKSSTEIGRPNGQGRIRRSNSMSNLRDRSPLNLSDHTPGQRGSLKHGQRNKSINLPFFFKGKRVRKGLGANS